MILSKEEHLKKLDLLERPMHDYEREDVQWGYGQLIKRVFDEDTPQLTIEELDYEIKQINDCIESCHLICENIRENDKINIEEIKATIEINQSILNKLQKQKEMLEK